MLTGGGGDKICQNLADVICERSLKSRFRGNLDEDPLPHNNHNVGKNHLNSVLKFSCRTRITNPFCCLK